MEHVATTWQAHGDHDAVHKRLHTRSKRCKRCASPMAAHGQCGSSTVCPGDVIVEMNGKVFAMSPDGYSNIFIQEKSVRRRKKAS